MSIIIGSARHDEYGNITGGAAGDQTGEEVSTQEFYMHSKGWYGYRPKSVDVANALATAMQQACDNNNIGYDQNQRDTLLTQFKKTMSIKAITTKCECDCSSLIRVCIYQAAGVLLSDFNTSSEPSTLANSGLFDKFTVNSSADVYNGDVLVTKSKGHTVAVISGRARSSSSSSGSGSGTSSGTTKVEDAAGFDSSIAGKYEVTASDGLNIRYGAGTSKSIVTTLSKGTTVQNYGYYTTVDGTKWLLVSMTDGKTGYGSSKYLSKVSGNSTSSGTSGGSMTEKADEETVWNYLYSKIGNAYGTAGVMGNMYAESSFIPINLQDSYENKLGYTDKTYTEAVDNGTYTNFVNDAAGYGLVQWTYYTLKQGLLEYCQGEKASIGNMDAQLEYLCIELQDEFASLWKTLKNATSVKEASDAMLTKFENPADQSDSVKEKRASYGQTYYDKYAGGSSGTTSGTTGVEDAASYDESIAGTYTVSNSGGLNIRYGAGTSKGLIVTISDGTDVQNYGYYTSVSGTKWLLVQFKYNNKEYTGYGSSKYLTKKSSSSSSGTGTTSSTKLDADGNIATNTVTRWQQVMGTTADGKIDGQQSKSKQYWTSISSTVCSWSGGTSALVKKWQQYLKDKGYSVGTGFVDGKLGKNTAKASQNFLKAKGYYTGSIDSIFGTNSAKALQNWLNAQ